MHRFTASSARALTLACISLCGCVTQLLGQQTFPIHRVNSTTLEQVEGALLQLGCVVTRHKDRATHSKSRPAWTWEALQVQCRNDAFRIGITKEPFGADELKLYAIDCDSGCKELMRQVVRLTQPVRQPVNEAEELASNQAQDEADGAEVQAPFETEANQPARVEPRRVPRRAHASMGLLPYAAPIAGEPLHCFSPGDDIYCLTRHMAIAALSDGHTALAIQSDPEYRTVDIACDVARGGAAACVYVEDRYEGPDNRRRTRRRISLVADGRVQRLDEGVVEDGFDASALGVLVDEGGVIHAWRVRRRVGNRSETHSFIAHGHQRMEIELPSASVAATLANIGEYRYAPELTLFRRAGKLWALARSGDAIVAAHVAPSQAGGVQALRWVTVAPRSQYDIRYVEGGDGLSYVFYYEPLLESAMVAVSADATSWRSIQLDTAESGWQMEAAPSASGATGLWYYNRNTYNKGLRTASLQNGRLGGPARTIVRNEHHNTGWQPTFGATDEGRMWFSWIDDQLAELRVWSTCESPSALERFTVRDTGDATDRRKDWYLQLGAGAWYTWWHVGELGLDAQDDGAHAGPARYSLDQALLLSTMFEARIGTVQLALGFAQSIVDAADDASGGNVTSFVGGAQFDQLFLGHDIQVRVTVGFYTGNARPGTSGDMDARGTLPIETRYTELQALALNKWRIRYGLSYATYRLPATVHTFLAQQGERNYVHTGSFFRQVSFHDVRFMLGYSKLDYVARYENRYSDIIADGDFSIGASFNDFESVPVGPSEQASSSVAIALGAHLDLGWLWLHRFRGASGLGLYVRPVYRGEFGLLAGGGKPKDREADQTGAADVEAGSSLVSYRHGPWLDIGVIW